ncbi:MAG TPA: CoA-binding protein [Candidatus Nanoarchaeia archaeon]|nr:CoA-binding protein [Candidatus Nanoarchaeia archaeon]
MKSRPLDPLFNPSSIAVIGASRRDNAAGHGVLKNLVTGGVFQTYFCKPFKGKVFAVNPNAAEILGVKCYSSVLEIEEQVNLAIICVPAETVIPVLKECGKKKVKAAIIIAAGFREAGQKGMLLQKKIDEVAKQYKIRYLGPNALGIIRTSWAMNASFSPTMPRSGDVAFVSQSGALADSIIDWAVSHRYGFSAVVSCGNQENIDAADLIEWLADDEETKAITVYLEGVPDGQKLMAAMKAASKKKPIIALKGGKSAAGHAAAQTHTAAIATEYEIFKAAFSQCNTHIVDTVEELFDTAKALAQQPVCAQKEIAIITNGGGAGVLCADYCHELGIPLAMIKESTLKKIDDSGKMHRAYSRRNPMDILGDALPERYEVAVNALLSDPGIGGLIVIQTMQTMTNSRKDAEVIVEARKRFPEKPIICTYLGGMLSKPGMDVLDSHNIPDYNDTRKAALAMKALIERAVFVKRKV